jgi:hypothetical protein
VLRLAAALLLLAGPAAALAGEKTLVVKTFEDPRHPATAADCAALGLPSNVVLGASVWSVQTRASRGEVMNETVKFLGTAVGCGVMTSPVPFTPDQKFLIKFDLGDGTYVAQGACDIVSITVPTTGLMLAGCALKIVSAPEGVLGGLATSASIFNPKGIPGFGTGSVWTLHLYTKDE